MREAAGLGVPAVPWLPTRRTQEVPLVLEIVRHGRWETTREPHSGRHRIARDRLTEDSYTTLLDATRAVSQVAASGHTRPGVMGRHRSAQPPKGHNPDGTAPRSRIGLDRRDSVGTPCRERIQELWVAGDQAWITHNDARTRLLGSRLGLSARGRRWWRTGVRCLMQQPRPSSRSNSSRGSVPLECVARRWSSLLAL